MTGLLVFGAGVLFVYLQRPYYGVDIITPAGDKTFSKSYNRADSASIVAAINDALIRHATALKEVSQIAPVIPDHYSTLLKLHELQEKGILSKEEFAAEKTKLLAR